MLTPLTYQILMALADEDRHGYGIIKEIEAQLGAGTAPSTGALYLALQRMESDGLVAESAQGSGEDARRRYYRLTRSGRTAARAESARLAALLRVARQKKLMGDA